MRKRSLAVDLSDPVVAAAVRALVLKADVVVANFRPGQAKKHGLDYERLSVENPRLIYAENTAYGRNGPMANAPGMDIVVAGYSGLLNISAEGPLMPPEPIIDYAAGLLLAWGVSTALYARERTGVGQRLDVIDEIRARDMRAQPIIAAGIGLPGVNVEHHRCVKNAQIRGAEMRV